MRGSLKGHSLVRGSLVRGSYSVICVSSSRAKGKEYIYIHIFRPPTDHRPTTARSTAKKKIGAARRSVGNSLFRGGAFAAVFPISGPRVENIILLHTLVTGEINMRNGLRFSPVYRCSNTYIIYCETSRRAHAEDDDTLDKRESKRYIQLYVP